MDRYKNEKGITLVALAITIIVMTILVGITVGTMYGKDGLITTAKEVKENQERAQEAAQEIIDAQKQEIRTTEDGTKIVEDKDAPTINSFDIETEGDDTIKLNVNVTENNSGIDTIQYSSDGGENYVTDVADSGAKKYTFRNMNSTVKYAMKVKVTDKAGNSSTAEKEIRISKIEQGDEVDYTPVPRTCVVEARYSGYSSDQTIKEDVNVTWKILKLDDENNEVQLTTTEPVTNSSFYLYGFKGYNNAIYYMNYVCSQLYSNEEVGATARCLNMEDIEAGFNDEGKSVKAGHTSGWGNSNYGKQYTLEYNSAYGDFYTPTLYWEEQGAGWQTSGTTRSEQHKSSPTTASYNRNHGFKGTLLTYNMSFAKNYYTDENVYNVLFGTTATYQVATYQIYCDPAWAMWGIYVIKNGGIGDLDCTLATDLGDQNTQKITFRPVITIPLDQMSKFKITY